MAYPRRCPLCEADYRGSPRIRGPVGVACEDRHATLSAGPGGTPSPWRPGAPGRLLTLRCLACRGEYGWDYFGGQPVAGAARATSARPAVETRTVAPRHLSKGQQAMAAAVVRLETKQHSQREMARSAGVNAGRLAQAEVILAHAPELGDPVLSGALPLNEAYGEARARKRAAPPTGTRTAGPRAEAGEDSAARRSRRRTY